MSLGQLSLHASFDDYSHDEKPGKAVVQDDEYNQVTINK